MSHVVTRLNSIPADLDGFWKSRPTKFDKDSNMEPTEEFKILIDWLKERGHTPEEIEKVLALVRDYEEKTQYDSVMDSIGAGRLTLDALVKEALGD